MVDSNLIPVFIGGCGRSGTTMLASLLGGQRDAIVTPESQFKINFLFDNSGEVNYDNIWRLNQWGMDQSQFKAIVSISDSKSEALCSLARQYCQGKSCDSPKFWIDHTPDNIRYVRELSSHFSDAKFIHIIRDGRAVASSLLKVKWGPKHVYSSAMWWFERVSLGLAAQYSYPDKMITVKYEDLVEFPERELIRLCDFIGMEYSESMLIGQGFQIPDYRKDQHALVGGAPDSSRVFAWREALSCSEVKVFERKAGSLLNCLGYPLESSLRTRKLGGLNYYENFKLKLQSFSLALYRKLASLSY